MTTLREPLDPPLSPSGLTRLPASLPPLLPAPPSLPCHHTFPPLSSTLPHVPLQQPASTSSHLPNSQLPTTHLPTLPPPPLLVSGRSASGNLHHASPSPSQATPAGPNQTPSFASLLLPPLATPSTPLLRDVPLPPRSNTTFQGCPTLFFSASEVQQASSAFANTIIIKFAAGNPSLPRIREDILSWKLTTPYSVGILDPRHVLLHMTSTVDLLSALSMESNRIASALYRSFR